MNTKKYFLLLASGAVAMIGLGYGVSPSWFASTFLPVDVLDLNLEHVLRAVMGIYVAFALFWAYAAFDDRLRTTAVLTTMIFSGGLVVGRLISIVVDGVPAVTLVVYLFLEVSLFLAAFWVLKRPD